MSIHRLLALSLALALLPAFGAGEDAQMIRSADIPRDAPRFEDHPAQPYAGANAPVDVGSDVRSRRYRTQLQNWAREKPNFAGHYIVATWGCGTGCTQVAVIDAASGKVFHPAGATVNYIMDVDPEVLVDIKDGERRADFGALHYRVDSKLLVVFGTPEGRAQNNGISYFVWEGDRLNRLRFVAKAAPGARQ
ncbi:MAG TPA: hypothetical protein VIL30_25050 [Ramlibacter sp.]|jgi:hypothetical protein